MKTISCALQKKNEEETDMKIQDGQRLVMIGDSITDVGRARPIGEGKGDALGRGYVSLVDAMLQATYPDRAIRITNMGISGNTVRHLKERWQTDVLDLNPDWLSVKIGINDVWRQFDSPSMPERSVYIEEYEDTYRELLEKTRSRLKGLVLMTPYFLEPNKEDPMRKMMDQYGEVVKKLAAEYDAILVDTQQAFDEYMKHVSPLALCADRVHPSLAGHAVIAKAFLNAIGFEW